MPQTWNCSGGDENGDMTFPRILVTDHQFYDEPVS